MISVPNEIHTPMTYVTSMLIEQSHPLVGILKTDVSGLTFMMLVDLLARPA